MARTQAMGLRFGLKGISQTKDVHLNDLDGAFFGHLINDLLQPFIHALNPNPPPRLRAPDHVILAGINHAVIGVIFHRLII
jgi:hypothetical protein